MPVESDDLRLVSIIFFAEPEISSLDYKSCELYFKCFRTKVQEFIGNENIVKLICCSANLRRVQIISWHEKVSVIFKNDVWEQFFR